MNTAEDAEKGGSTSPICHERCRAAIAGIPVDRAPTFALAIACDVSSKILGRPSHTGTGSLHYAEVRAWAQGKAAHDDFVAQFMEDIVAIHRALDLDVFRMPWRMNERPTKQLDEFTFLFGDPDSDHTVWRYNPETADGGVLRRVCSRPFDEDPLREEIERAETDLKSTKSETPKPPEEHVQVCGQLGREFFVVCTGGGISVGYSEEDFMALALWPDLVRRKVMVQAEHAIRLGRALAQNNCPKVLLGGGDMADNRSTLYSAQTFREVVLPACKHLLAGLKPLGVHYVFRSDGNLWPVADLLFREAACPGYGEADRDASMKLGELRRRFPRLVVWGHVSSSFVQAATVPQVKDECRRILDESGGTGYFHGCSNAIVKGTPPANVEAMFSVR